MVPSAPGRGGCQVAGGQTSTDVLSFRQRAMGYARRHPEPEKRGRGNKRTAGGEFSGVSQQRVSDARAVLSHSEDLAMVGLCRLNK